MNDYERIARIIHYLDERKEDQPDLAELAAYADLSPSRLHDLFSRWAGITPKEFLQCLTFSYAKKMLKEGASILDASVNAGLSGPGRLHDLCIKLEAATPGEIKLGGAGWTLLAGFADSPFGRCFIAEGPRGICRISFPDPSEKDEEVDALKKQWPSVAVKKDDRAAGKLVEQIFDHNPKSRLSLKAYVRGTEFQVKVWQALLRIPQGRFLSYGHLAALIGKPTASRAVGTAVGNNPIGFLIPCHRVIRETGAIGGYRWGNTRKRAIQAWESSSNI